MAGTGTGAGVSARLRYDYETTYGDGEPTTPNWKVFGGDQVITTFTASNNNQILRQYNSREIWREIPKQFDGRITVECTLANPFWLTAMFGATPTTTGPAGSVYTHTWDYSSTAVSDTIKSMFIDLEIDMINEDKAWEISGVVLNSVTISAATNEPVKGTFDMYYKEATLAASAGAAPPTESYTPLIFDDATLTPASAIGSRTNYGVIQRFTLTVNNNYTQQYGLGSRYPQRVVPGPWDVTSQMSVSMEDSELFQDVLDAVQHLDATFLLDTGGTGADTESISFALADCFLGEHSISINHNDPLIEDLPMRFAKASATVSNTDDGTGFA